MSTQQTHKAGDTVKIYCGKHCEGEAVLESLIGRFGKLEKWQVRFKDASSNRTFPRYIKSK